MAMAAGGGRGQILGGGEGFGLAFKADALWVGTRTNAATGPNGNLKATNAVVNRLRTAIEGSQKMTIAGRLALTPSVEIGIRQDGGDAETGRGVDLGAGLVLADGVTGTRGRHPRAQAARPPSRRLRRERHVDLGELQPNAVYPTRLHRTRRAGVGRQVDERSRRTVGSREHGRDGTGPPARTVAATDSTRRSATACPSVRSARRHAAGSGSERPSTARTTVSATACEALEQGGVNLQLGVEAEHRVSPALQTREAAGAADQRVLGTARVSW